MRAPMSWLREYAALPPEVTGRELAERLVALGLEVETVEDLGADISGPVVVGRVRSFEDETHKNGKTVRWCQVDVGEDEPRGIVCGALNFAVGDHVVVALPGAVLPGGFEIGARKTYGHVSDGMICSTLELRVGDDHAGILVLTGEHEVGSDAVAALGLDDEVLDIAVTPDRSYCLSVRGLAREAATAYDVAFTDPALPQAGEDAGVDGRGHPAAIEDAGAADRLVLRTVAGLDPAAATPWWLARRLLLCGMRPVSLAVDVTNYVMLELGQPLHAFDLGRLQGAVRVRSARDGEKLETLDHVRRDLDPDDVVIADDSGVVGLAGTMGGLATEITPESTDLAIEAAHFVPARVGRTARRHKLPSEASKRFERGVDPELPPVASARAVRLLTDLGGARAEGSAEADQPRATRRILLDPGRPGRTAGMPIDRDTVLRGLRVVGAVVEDETADPLPVVPPAWRPDLADPADLDEEVIRVAGYDRIPAVLPVAPAGRGLTQEQRLRRRIGLALAHRGYVEAPSTPFVGEDGWDALGLPDDDARRRALRLANPLSDEAPLLRTTLLPGLLAALRRNVGRGTPDVALFEVGLVFRPETVPLPAAPRPPVDRRPSPDEVAALDAALPRQPWRVATVLAGRRERDGWWGTGRDATWADAVEAARAVAAQAGAALQARTDQLAPWHPGRCAALLVGDEVVGHAGELHPRVVEALDLPARTVAMELEIGLLGATFEPVPAPALSTYPVATQDVAIVVADDVPAAAVESALRDGAGELLESVRLFDLYRGAQVGEGRVSLAYALRFRARDRTLTAEEVGAAREAAVAEAVRRCGAEQRGG